jgi:phosphate:Na+ symporter
VTTELDKFALFAGLFGGLALFLFGMDVMTGALKRAVGDHMKDFLARLTRNRLMAVGVGALVTGLVNSSSVTTVILVGFISAGLLSMVQSVGVIMGANIGSTVTAQILAFKVTQYALPMITIGMLVAFLSRRDDWREYGKVLLGFGLVFHGMAVMSDAMSPLRSHAPFIEFIVALSNPLAAAAIGAVFTAVIQSSAATTGLVIVLAGQGLMSLEAAIAVALGANIGTCATAGLAAIGKPREAVRTAVVHVLFNIAGVIIWIGFVPELADLVRAISPKAEDLTGLARAAAEAPRQVANAHTIFNVVNTVLFIGFTTQIARFVEWLVPDRPLAEAERFAPRYLDDQLLGTPSIALDAARREIVRLGGLVREMLDAVIPTATSGSRLQLEQLEAMDRPVDTLHREIIGYLRKVSLSNLSNDQSDLLIALIKIANDLEHIGDQIATNIIASSRKRIDENVVISQPTAAAIAELHGKVAEALDEALKALDQEDPARAAKVRAMKQDLAEMIEKIARHGIARLQADEPRRLITYAREIELIEILDDIFKTTRRIARTQIKGFEIALSGELSPAEENAT